MSNTRMCFNVDSRNGIGYRVWPVAGNPETFPTIEEAVNAYVERNKWNHGFDDHEKAVFKWKVENDIAYVTFL